MLLLLFAAAALLLGCRPDTDARLLALRDELLPKLEAVTGLDARAEVPVEERSREQVREFVLQQLEENLPAAERAGIAAAYAELGLIPDTLDFGALLVELYTEQVVGYYDPRAKTMYVVAGAPRAAVESVLAHELVHALQDQYVNLDSLIGRERGNDAQTAAQSAIEGHATLAMVLLEAGAPRNALDPAAIPDLGARLRPALETLNDEFPVFRDAPAIIRELMLFPYLGGASFVQAAWSRAAETRTLPRIDRIIPASTEQVLHPDERFLTTVDAATRVVLGGNPAGWQTVYENNLGELEISIMLREHGGDPSRSLPRAKPRGSGQAARGWDGDAYRLLESPAGARVLVWYSVWDDADSAERFAAALRAYGAQSLPSSALSVEVTQHAGRPLVIAGISRNAAAGAPRLPLRLEEVR